MARKRMIDPYIWEDPDFNSLSRDARLLFIGMVSNADDEGYLRGHAGNLRRLIFGFDDDLSVEYTQKLLQELATKMKSVHVFYVEDQAYIHFTNWFKWQKQQKDRIVASVFPKCVTCLASDKQLVNTVDTDAIPLLTEVKLSKVSKVNTGNTEFQKSEKNNEKPLQDIVNKRFDKLKPTTDTTQEQPEWQRTSIYYAEKLGFVDTLSSDEMERFLKAGKDAIALGRKTNNFHQAFTYVIDHEQKDPHQILKLFFKIYENGLQRLNGYGTT